MDNKLDQLVIKEEMAESTVRTYYMLMEVAAERMNCMMTAMKHAKSGQEAYALLSTIREEISTMKSIQDDVTKTISFRLQDPEKLLHNKLNLLKVLYKEGKIDDHTYNVSIRKVKREFYNIKLA